MQYFRGESSADDILNTCLQAAAEEELAFAGTVRRVDLGHRELDLHIQPPTNSPNREPRKRVLLRQKGGMPHGGPDV